MWDDPSYGSRVTARAAFVAVSRASQALVWLPVLHLGVLAIAGVGDPRPVPLRLHPRTRFVVVVPGRNEERVVVSAVASLTNADYPAALLHVVVLADNCTDGTARVARATGVEVWERHDLEQANKGAALAWAFERLLAKDKNWDAILVLDADGTVAPDLFRILDARIDEVAVLQAERRVGNPHPTLMTRLSEISSDAQTVLRPRARERLGGVAKLVGTGMVFRRDVLEAVPWTAQGLVEDLEYWLQLLTRGVRPRFEPRAQVADLMPETMAEARRQRERWQVGRSGLTRDRAGSAVLLALQRRDWLMVEAVVSELLLPTLSVTAAAVVGCAVLSWTFTGQGARTGLLQAGVVAGHVVCGLRAAHAPTATYAALAVSPLAVMWKFTLVVRTRIHPPSRRWQGSRRVG